MKAVLAVIAAAVALLVVIGVVYAALIGIGALCWMSGDERSIENGLSAKLRAMLEDDYQLTLPEDAVFVEGRYSYPQEGAFLIIKFKVKTDGLADRSRVALGSSWVSSDYPEISGGLADVGEGYYTFSGTAFPRETFLTCEEKDGWLSFYFHGYNPPKRIL